MTDASPPPAPDEEPDETTDVPEDAPEDSARFYPSTVGGALYLLVMAATAVGIVVVGLGPWRTGVRIVAGALLAAAALRFVLPTKDAGMLAVRHRAFDTVLLAVLGGVLVFLTYSIPDQPV
jgi:hypothetical protein